MLKMLASLSRVWFACLLLLVVVSRAPSVVQGGFVAVVPSSTTKARTAAAPLQHQLRPAPALSSSSGGAGDNKDDGVDNQKKLSQLGYSPAEIQRSRDADKRDDDDEIRVNVNLLPDVDAVTLTAVGFGLIAANFFIFANMGDGGIAGMGKSIGCYCRQ